MIVSSSANSVDYVELTLFLALAAVRVEWAKARARKTRWEEEVLLLREEMKRVLRFLDWKIHWWEDRSGSREDEVPQVRGGLTAYALRQAALLRDIRSRFRQRWSEPLASISPGEDIDLSSTFVADAVAAAAADNDA